MSHSGKSSTEDASVGTVIVVARPLGLGKDARVERARVCSQKVGYHSKEVIKCLQNPHYQVCQLSFVNNGRWGV
jgi:hypothetical protein